MPTTSNFGWTTPADTDLVKDGASAIRTLGNGIDTSMAQLKGGSTGQVLSKTSGTDMAFTWVTTDDANAIQNAIVDAKGDLIAATANDTPARLAVGNNGETLVADSSATTGLRWQGNFAAGKNVILNADFRLNQRSFSTTTTSGDYGFDRWRYTYSNGTCTYSAQTFTAGTAPVTGYEAINFARIDSTGQTLTSANCIFNQRIEDGRTFANSTIVISFWAKASSGTPKVAVEITQNFGTGGSPSSAVNTYVGQVTLSTSWTRYSVSLTVPSVSGKTFGTTANTSFLQLALWTSAGSDFNARTGSLGIQTATIDFWGVQIEQGSVATAFQTATGTLAGELAACQRYYVRLGAKDGGTTSAYDVFAQGLAGSTGGPGCWARLPVTMRVAPTAIDYANLAIYDNVTVTGTPDSVTLITAEGGRDYAKVYWAKTSSTTAFRPYVILANNNTSAYLGFSAEL
jgi:hypothetical protein